VIGRIDYVRIRVNGDKANRVNYGLELQQRVDQLCEKHGIAGKPRENYTLFDRALKLWVTNFNVWGRAADLLYNELQESEFNLVTRLDYRADCDNPDLDLELVGRVAFSQAKKKGLARSFHDGPVRSKANGRDVGGPSVVVGGQGSARRISLYQRGHEKPGVEAQISGDRIKKVIQSAYDLKLTTNGDLHDIIRDYLLKELETLCRERLLHPLHAFLEGGQIDAQIEAEDTQYRVYEQMSLYWLFLDADKQEEFRNDISGNEWVNIANRFNHSPVEEELFLDDEPEDLYTDEELRNIANSDLDSYYDMKERENAQDDYPDSYRDDVA